MGHLGQWVEFHSLRRKAQTSAEREEQSDKVDLIEPASPGLKKERQGKIVPEASQSSSQKRSSDTIQEEV